MLGFQQHVEFMLFRCFFSFMDIICRLCRTNARPFIRPPLTQRSNQQRVDCIGQDVQDGVSIAPAARHCDVCEQRGSRWRCRSPLPPICCLFDWSLGCGPLLSFLYHYYMHIEILYYLIQSYSDTSVLLLNLRCRSCHVGLVATGQGVSISSALCLRRVAADPRLNCFLFLFPWKEPPGEAISRP